MRLPRRCTPRNDREAEESTLVYLCPAVHPAGELFTTNAVSKKLKMRLPRRCAPRNDR